VKIEIPGRLPGLNEMIDAAKQGRGKYQPYNTMKNEYTNMVAWLAKKFTACKGQVDIAITWHEPNQRRDLDNIMAGQKFILDGLVRAGTLPNDSQKYINSITHKFETDKENPRIEVKIHEKEKQLNPKT